MTAEAAGRPALEVLPAAGAARVTRHPLLADLAEAYSARRAALL